MHFFVPLLQCASKSNMLNGPDSLDGLTFEIPALRRVQRQAAFSSEDLVVPGVLGHRQGAPLHHVRAIIFQVLPGPAFQVGMVFLRPLESLPHQVDHLGDLVAEVPVPSISCPGTQEHP